MEVSIISRIEKFTTIMADSSVEKIIQHEISDSSIDAVVLDVPLVRMPYVGFVPTLVMKALA